MMLCNEKKILLPISEGMSNYEVDAVCLEQTNSTE